MSQIKWEQHDNVLYSGRNGTGFSCGIDVIRDVWDPPQLQITPINSRDELVSRTHVPLLLSAVGKFVRLLMREHADWVKAEAQKQKLTTDNVLIATRALRQVTLDEQVFIAASAKGLTDPVWADNSSGEPTIVDLDTGKCYVVETRLREV